MATITQTEKEAAHLQAQVLSLQDTEPWKRYDNLTKTLDAVCGWVLTRLAAGQGVTPVLARRYVVEALETYEVFCGVGDVPPNDEAYIACRDALSRALGYTISGFQ